MSFSFSFEFSWETNKRLRTACQCVFWMKASEHCVCVCLHCVSKKEKNLAGFAKHIRKLSDFEILYEVGNWSTKRFKGRDNCPFRFAPKITLVLSENQTKYSGHGNQLRYKRMRHFSVHSYQDVWASPWPIVTVQVHRIDNNMRRH